MHPIDPIDVGREATPPPPPPPLPLPSLAALRRTTAEAVRAAAAGDDTALLACLTTPPPPAATSAAAASARRDDTHGGANDATVSSTPPPVVRRSLEALGFGAPRVDRAFALAAAAQLCDVLTASTSDENDHDHARRRWQSASPYHPYHPTASSPPPTIGHHSREVEVDRTALEAAAALALALIEEGERGDFYDAAMTATATATAAAVTATDASDESFAAGARLADAALRCASWAQAANAPSTTMGCVERERESAAGRAGGDGGGGGGAAEEEAEEAQEEGLALARLARHAATSSPRLLRLLSDAAVSGAWAYRGRRAFLAQLSAAAKLLVHRPLLPVQDSWCNEYTNSNVTATVSRTVDHSLETIHPTTTMTIHPMLPLAEACRRCPELLAEAHSTLQLWVAASGGHPQLLRASEVLAGPRMIGVLFPHAMTPLLQLLEQPPTTSTSTASSPPAAFAAANMLRTQALGSVGGCGGVASDGDGGNGACHVQPTPTVFTNPRRLHCDVAETRYHSAFSATSLRACGSKLTQGYKPRYTTTTSHRRVVPDRFA